MAMLQLPDKQRSYTAIVNREGKIFWFEHERCTVAKANDVFRHLELEYMTIEPWMLPRHSNLRSKLYGRVELETTPLILENSRLARTSPLDRGVNGSGKKQLDRH